MAHWKPSPCRTVAQPAQDGNCRCHIDFGERLFYCEQTIRSLRINLTVTLVLAYHFTCHLPGWTGFMP
jgi:hypothetical protein